MQAITTKYLGPTNVRGARIKAQNPDGLSVIIGYDHALSQMKAHQKAANALCAKLDWHGRLIGGYIGKCRYAWVFDDVSPRER